MYQALYRKWRPQTFDAVVGQKHITETLKNQVRTGRLSHAYLFIGTRGTGKTTCARILAKAVNCEHPVDGNPCGECAACRGISEGSIMDVVELDAASNNGVDNVRALREEAVFSPASVKKRVYIIDEVHMLSSSAFNALLKILEEPPEHLMFILATTELQKVPATILSRCQRHSFRRIDAPEIADYLEYIAGKEDFSLTYEAAQLIARLAEGGVRDALSLLDQCSASKTIDAEAVYSAMGLAGNLRTVKLMEGILDRKTQEVIEQFNALWMDGKDPATLLGELNGLMRDVLMLRVAPRTAMSLITDGYGAATLEKLAKRMTTEELICAMGTVERALGGMRDTKSPKIAAELCLISLCDNTMGESVAELRARISRLEEQMKRGLPTAAPDRYEPEEDERESAVPDEQEAQALYDTGAKARPEMYPEAEYDDELDPAMFTEEQPEDSFVLRTDKAAAGPPAGEGDVVKNDEDIWKAVCAIAAPKLPMDIKLKLGDESAVRGHVENGLLKVEAAPGFVYGRFNRPDVIVKLSEAASEVCGREMHAVIAELKENPRIKRSLEELKQFKEVRFN